MALKRFLALLTTALAIVLTGCGTALNFHDGSNSLWLKNDEPRKVYGGVSLDAQCGSSLLVEAVTEVEPICLAWGAWILAVDLPLSAVADTLTLPFTIPASIDRSIDDFYLPRPKPAGQTEKGQTEKGNGKEGIVD